jgi:hypothetical protein
MKFLKYLQVPSRFAVTAVVVLATIIPFITFSTANAFGLISSRSIQMSSSASGATGNSYKVNFSIGTSGSIGGIVVDFCSNDPIISDTTCTTTSVPTLVSPTVSGQSSGAGCVLTTFTTVGTLNSNRTLTLTAGSPVAMTATTACTFTINGVTNPTPANTTFYARIYTYNAAAGATGYTVANPAAGGTIQDAGGIALSTAAAITVTAKVQEQLTFCVYTGVNCAAGGTAVTLGNTQGVLSSAGPYVDKTTSYDVQTNAGGGAAINMKGTTLTSGSNTIAAMGATAIASAAGTSQFGLCSYESAGSNITIDSPYNDSHCSTTTQTAGTGSTGGIGTPPLPSTRTIPTEQPQPMETI